MKNVKRTFCALLAFVLALGALSGCGSQELSDDEIFEILEEHNLPFYVGSGVAGWYGSTRDNARVSYAEELLSMFEALGEDVGDYDAEGLADAISEEFDDFTDGSIFEWACWLLDIDEARYLEIYEARDYLLSIYGGEEAALEGTWYWNENEDVWLYFDGEWEINACDLGGYHEGIYSYDGETLTFHLSDDNFTQTYAGRLDSDGDIQIDDMDGWFVLGGAPAEISSSPQSGGYEHELEGVWNHSSRDGYLSFDGVGSVRMYSGEYGEVTVSYMYDGNTITIFNPENPDDYSLGYIDSDGDIQMEDAEGWFVREAAGYTDSSTDFGYYDNGDGTADYIDYDRNVSFTCPTWMLVMTEGIGMSTDATLVTDNNDGFVICDNVSSEWASFIGSNEEYVLDYFHSFFAELTDPIFGAWDDGYLDTSQNRALPAGCLAAMEGNYWNSYYDVNIVIWLESAETGYVVKLFLAPYGEDEQMQTLLDSVVNVSGVN